MSYIIETTFLDTKKHLWDKRVLNKMFKELENFQKENSEESKERCFIMLMLEFQQAYRTFLIAINDLPLIMSCRVKGDNSSHFGGLECAEFMKALRASAEKYLKESAFSFLTSEGTIVYVISKIKNKAKEDEKIAKELEKDIREDYLSLGVDNTLKALEEAGYRFENRSSSESKLENSNHI